MKNSQIVFNVPGSSHIFQIILGSKVRARLFKLSGLSNNCETGGVLIGRYSSDASRAHVLGVWGPPEDSIKTPSEFERGTKNLNKRLKALWANKNRYYLGEWHYHPNGRTTASAVDARQMRAIAEGEDYAPTAPILIIVGANNSLGCYVHDANRSPTLLAAGKTA